MTNRKINNIKQRKCIWINKSNKSHEINCENSFTITAELYGNVHKTTPFTSVDNHIRNIHKKGEVIKPALVPSCSADMAEFRRNTRPNRKHYNRSFR